MGLANYGEETKSYPIFSLYSAPKSALRFADGKLNELTIDLKMVSIGHPYAILRELLFQF